MLGGISQGLDTTEVKTARFFLTPKHLKTDGELLELYWSDKEAYTLTLSLQKAVNKSLVKQKLH